MDHVLAHQVLVPLVLGVHGHAGVAQHGLYPGGGHHDLLRAALHLVGEADDHPELDLVLVPRHREQGPARQLHLVNLDIGDGGPVLYSLSNIWTENICCPRKNILVHT